MKLLPLFAFLSIPFAAAFAADATPQISERGKAIVSDDLSKTMDPAWKTAKGKWEIKDGAARGNEIASDNHAGVMRREAPFKDAIIQVEAKLEGSKSATISINGAKGHQARVLLSPDGYTAQKDDSDHEGPDKAKVFGHRAVALKPGEWHQIQIEFSGDTMVAMLDGANPIAGTHEAIAQPKANIGFTTAGEFVSFRNLRIWEATPKAGAETTKAKLLADSADQLAKAPSVPPARRAAAPKGAAGQAGEAKPGAGQSPAVKAQ